MKHIKMLPEDRCIYEPDNEFVWCAEPDRMCDKCGWNPAVRRKRIETLKKGWKNE